MKLQVAIDRVKLDDAVRVANQLDSVVDIIEFGTSLVKDYGLLAIKHADLNLHHAQLLIDLKTIDEGPYEFKQGFAAGADILTIMGASSVDTIKKVYEIAEAQDKEMFIDMMGINQEQREQISTFNKAIYGIHHAVDEEHGFDAVKTVADFHQKFPEIARISVAGGINLEVAQELAQQGIVESVIVGSGIMEASNPVAAAQKFMEVTN